MLLTQNISLFRSNKKIFENINLSINSSKIIMLKGRNGSGKTSFLKTLLNIIEPTSGTIYWKGKLLKNNLSDYFKNVTYISDKTSSVRELTLYENIKVWRKISLSNIKDEQIEKTLKMLNLYILSNSKVNTLSLGELKKLELLRLIIDNKKLWILDEPLTNLDTDTINIIGKTFEDHCNNKGSIILTSHQKPEIRVSEEINF